jgi:glutamate/tyrosine decarboxylase-like PLP-dependent enzyme
MAERRATLPAKGESRERVLEQLKAYGADDPDYRAQRTWSLVYYLGEEHTRFLEEAHNLYFSANGLNPMAFRSLKRFESEVVGMTAGMLHGGEGVCGTMTSCGTESCLLAVKTYRDLARARKPWLRRPEMVIPETAHVAWEKGAEYFGVKPVRAPLGADHRVDVDAVRRLVGRRTVMILGSAPEYPHGMIDPIEDLGAIAQEKKVPLHVDACLGGYLLPFVELLGRPLPRWDFRVPGVTSISADTHKYGFSAKGASVILYRDVEILKHQLFVYESWPGGIFASPGILGTRAGGSIAAAWASMRVFGRDGYTDLARQTMDVADELKDGIRKIPALALIGDPPASVFAYRSVDRTVNVFAVGDRMEARGWHIDRLQRPEALHAMVTPLHARVAKQYLDDLAASVAEVARDPALAQSGSAPMYGMIAAVPLRRMVKSQVVKMMMDLYGPGGKLPEMASQASGPGSSASLPLAERAGRLYLALRNRLR